MRFNLFDATYVYHGHKHGYALRGVHGKPAIIPSGFIKADPLHYFYDTKRDSYYMNYDSDSDFIEAVNNGAMNLRDDKYNQKIYHGIKDSAKQYKEWKEAAGLSPLCPLFTPWPPAPGSPQYELWEHMPYNGKGSVWQKLYSCESWPYMMEHESKMKHKPAPVGAPVDATPGDIWTDPDSGYTYVYTEDNWTKKKPTKPHLNYFDSSKVYTLAKIFALPKFHYTGIKPPQDPKALSVGDTWTDPDGFKYKWDGTYWMPKSQPVTLESASSFLQSLQEDYTKNILYAPPLPV